jgi:hypothetical protein
VNSVSADDDDFGHFTDGGAVESHSLSANSSAGNSNLSFEELMNQNRQKEE